MPAINFPGIDSGVVWNDVSPRLGFTYDVSGVGKSLVRGSYSIYYGQMAPGQLAAVMLGIRMLGADDAEARQTVAQRQRNGFRDKGMLRPAFGLSKRDVPRRKIDVIDAE